MTVHVQLIDEENTEEVFVIPVFLQFHHQRQAEALEEALPSLERKLHSLLNESLSSK